MSPQVEGCGASSRAISKGCRWGTDPASKPRALPASGKLFEDGPLYRHNFMISQGAKRINMQTHKLRAKSYWNHSTRRLSPAWREVQDPMRQ